MRRHGNTGTLEPAAGAGRAEAVPVAPAAAPAERLDLREPGHRLVRRRRVRDFPLHSGPVGWVAGQQLTMLEWHLLTTLTGLDLDPSEYVIMGTGALISYGLPRQISDLDVLVQGAAWDKVRAHADAEFVQGAFSGDDVVKLHGGYLEFSATWFGGSTTAEIIARGDLLVFEDWGTSQRMRFASLADSLQYKTRLNRAKDLADLNGIGIPPEQALAA